MPNRLGKIAAAAGGGILGVIAMIVAITLQLFFVGLFVVLGVRVFEAVTSQIHHTQDKQTVSANTISHGPYAATQDNFTINFPGNPSIDEIPADNSTGITGGRSYDLKTDNAEYDVSIVNFSGDLSTLTDSQVRDALQSDLNHSAQSSNLNIDSSQFINFQNHLALQSKLSSSQYPNVEQVTFYRGNGEVVIATFDVSDNGFNSFANSFHSNL